MDRGESIQLVQELMDVCYAIGHDEGWGYSPERQKDIRTRNALEKKILDAMEQGGTSEP